MTKPDAGILLVALAAAALGQLLAITGIFYVVANSAWLWFPIPGGAYLGLRYFEEHAKEIVRKSCE